MRQRLLVDLSPIVEVVGHDDQRVAFPVADRIPEERPRRIRRHGLSVHVDVAHVVRHFVQHGDQTRRVDILDRIRRCDQTRHAMREALRRSIRDRCPSLLHVEVVLATGRLERSHRQQLRGLRRWHALLGDWAECAVVPTGIPDAREVARIRRSRILVPLLRVFLVPRCDLLGRRPRAPRRRSPLFLSRNRSRDSEQAACRQAARDQPFSHPPLRIL